MLKQTQDSVTPDVRVIKIMTGRKVFLGKVISEPYQKVGAETNRIEKRPIKWVELFRNISGEGD
jgi:hypothetical protein